MADRIRITSGVLPETTRVVAFRGREAISSPYEFEIFLSVPRTADDEIDLADAIGAKAVLSIDAERGTGPDREQVPFLFAGILAICELAHETAERTLVRAVLVPRLWELGLSAHSRIFTKMSALEVIQQVLRDAGISGSNLDVRIAPGEVEEHITQYRESDLAFISRWMEREGIFYFFEHGPKGEKLVLADKKSYPTELLGEPVIYAASAGADSSRKGSLSRFTMRHAMTTGQVRLRDYDYSNPQFELGGEAAVAGQGGAEVNLYGERFFTADSGKRLAKVRAEELACRGVVFQGSGTRLHLRAGSSFALEGHPRASMNTKYLITETQHRGAQAVGDGWVAERFGIDPNESYAVDLEAIPADVQFRPARRVAWPRIYGFENGQVEGPGASEYAQIDDQGRYLVKMRFDEGNSRGTRSSTYVRMMQPHGGGVEGFHFPLRKHTEVVVSFLGGDPDRPVISGVVPNALTPSPVTSGNHTKNVIQTGARNRLEIEDLAGAERVTLTTPYSNTVLLMGCPDAGHEAILKTDDNALLSAGQSYDVRVGKNMDVLVGVDYTNNVTAGKYTIDVHAGPFKLHTLASTVDIISNTDFRLESETAHGNIDAETFLRMDAKTSFGYFGSETKMTVTSRTADVEVLANQNFLVQAENATGTVKSKTKLLLESQTADAELHAATGINIHTDASGIQVTAPADIDIHSTGGMVNVTSGGKSTFSFFGDQTTINQAASSTYTYGSARNIRLGTDALYSLTAKTELSAGISFAMKMSLALEVSASMAIKMTVFKAELETLKQTMCVLNNANHGVNMRGAAAWLGSHGFKGNVGGIELHA